MKEWWTLWIKSEKHQRSVIIRIKYPHSFAKEIMQKIVDIVYIYMPKRFSPIFTTSPAPIVINKSLGIQLTKRKFSISSKDEK